MALKYVFEPNPGILGTSVAPDLLYWVSNHLEAGTTFLLIDLKHTTRVDSSGIGTLMIAYNRVRRVGSTLALCSLKPEVRINLERAGLLDKFDVYTDRREFENFVSGDDDLSHRRL
ncbi:MAG: STAS domain-containing protein [Leptolyngbyaceae bacterium]|nr:STAS domain-containing protein [Leptolyngbyaceae bacterium]